MPLSEHEQRLLEQMERALYAEDPKFASSLRGKDPRSNFRRRVLLAGVVAIAAYSVRFRPRYLQVSKIPGLRPGGRANARP